jgi:hypothetical protein
MAGAFNFGGIGVRLHDGRKQARSLQSGTGARFARSDASDESEAAERTNSGAEAAVSLAINQTAGWL